MAEITCLQSAMIERAVWDNNVTVEQREHARHCPACAMVLAATEKACHALQVLQPLPASDPATAAAWSRVQEQLPGTGMPAWSGKAVRWSLAACALLALAVTGRYVATRENPRPLAFAHVDSATIAANAPTASLAAPSRPAACPARVAPRAIHNSEYTVFNLAEPVTMYTYDRAGYTYTAWDAAGNYLQMPPSPPAEARSADVLVMPLDGPRAVERHASIALCVDDARAELATLTAQLSGMGGGLLTSQLNQPAGGAGTEIALAVRVPAAQFDSFVAIVHARGDILAESIAVADRGPSPAELERLISATDTAIAALADSIARFHRHAGDVSYCSTVDELWRRQQQRDELAGRLLNLQQSTNHVVFDLILRETTMVSMAEINTAGRPWFALRHACGRASGLLLTVSVYLIVGGGALLPVALLGWFVWRRLRPRFFSW